MVKETTHENDECLFFCFCFVYVLYWTYKIVDFALPRSATSALAELLFLIVVS